VAVTYPIIGATVLGFTTINTFNVPKPAGIVDGDYLVMVINAQTQQTSDWTLPAGWTRIGQGYPNGTNGTAATARVTYFYGKPIPSASAETATNYAVQPGAPTGQRYHVHVLVARGVDPTTPVTAIADKYGVSSSTQPFCSLPFTATAPVAGSILFVAHTEATSVVNTAFSSISNTLNSTWTQQYYEATEGTTAYTPGVNTVSLTVAGIWTAPINGGQSPGTINWNYVGPYANQLTSQAVVLNAYVPPGSSSFTVDNPENLSDSISVSIRSGVTQIAGSGAAVTTGDNAVVTLAKPGGVQDTDLLLAVIRCQLATLNVEYVPPAGWTVITPVSNGTNSRLNMIAYKVIPSAAAETATSYTFTSAATPHSGRVIGRIYRVTNVDNADPLSVISPAWGSHLQTGSVFTVPDAVSNGLLFAFYGATLAAPNDGTFVSMTGTGLTYNQYDYLSAGGAAGDTTVPRDVMGISTSAVSIGQGLGSQTYTFVGPASSASHGFGFVLHAVTVPINWSASASENEALTDRAVALISPAGTANLNDDLPVHDSMTLVQGRNLTADISDSVALTDRGPTPVEFWLTNTPNYIAHRGGSVSYPEETLYAYKHAAAWNPNLALEVSIWKTVDNVWVGSHDQTTGRVFGTDIDIPSNTWATLSQLRTLTGSQPMMQLTELLALYGGNRVIVVDNKGGQDLAGLTALLASYGGPNWFIMKTYFSGSNNTDVMRTSGYKVWGYYYEGDQTANIPNTHSHFDILGMDYSATQAAWDSVLSYAQPVWAHILPNTAAKTTADSKAASSVAGGATGTLIGYMVSGVTVVVPMVDAGNAQINDWIDLKDSFSSSIYLTDPLPIDSASIGDGFFVQFLLDAHPADLVQLHDSFGSVLGVFYPIQDNLYITDVFSTHGDYKVNVNESVGIVDYFGSSNGIGRFEVYTSLGLIPLSVQGIYQSGIVVPCTFFLY